MIEQQPSVCAKIYHVKFAYWEWQLALLLDNNHLLTFIFHSLCRYEAFFGRFGTSHFCVTQAMQRWLQTNWAISYVPFVHLCYCRFSVSNGLCIRKEKEINKKRMFLSFHYIEGCSLILYVYPLYFCYSIPVLKFCMTVLRIFFTVVLFLSVTRSVPFFISFLVLPRNFPIV